MDVIKKTDIGVIWYDVANRTYRHTTDEKNCENRFNHASFQLNETMTPDFICAIADHIRGKEQPETRKQGTKK